MAEQLSEEKRFEIVISWCNGAPISEMLKVFFVDSGFDEGGAK